MIVSFIDFRSFMLRSATTTMWQSRGGEKKIVFQPWDYSRSAALICNSSPSWSISDLRANNFIPTAQKTSPSKRRQTVNGKEISFVQQIRICNSRINWNFLIGAAVGQRELSDSQHDPTHPWYPLVTSERIKNSTECKMCTTGEGEWGWW